MSDAVIFDWDGTLVDSQRSMVNSFQDSLKSIGCRVSDEFIKRRIGIGARNTFRAALGVVSRKVNEKTIDELVKKKVETQLQWTESVRLLGGARDLINSLRGKVKMALASMNNGRVIEKLLVEMDLRRVFNVVLTANDVLNAKPHPEIFLKCAAKLQCSGLKCVVLEDSIFGVEAAKRAKMRCIAVPTGAYSEELREKDPDLIVSSLREKEKILGFIFR